MKIRNETDSPEVHELLAAREIEVDCWRCRNQMFLTVRWVSEHRDMTCPACGTLIVLNTSKRQNEVARLKRQLLELHAQMSDVLGQASSNANPLPRAVNASRGPLALESRAARLNSESAASGQRRARAGRAAPKAV